MLGYNVSLVLYFSYQVNINY